MSAVLDQAALAVVAAGLVALAVAALVARHWRAGLGMALELWTAAALLRLAAGTGWDRVVAAAAVVAVGRVAGGGLRSGRPARGAAVSDR